MASLEQVLSRLRKVSRACLPAAESPEILRLVTKLRAAFAEPLVCSGMSGRSSTSSSSSLLAWVRATAWSSISEAGDPGEDPIEPLPQGRPTGSGRVVLVELEIG